MGATEGKQDKIVECESESWALGRKLDRQEGKTGGTDMWHEGIVGLEMSELIEKGKWRYNRMWCQSDMIEFKII